MAMDLQILGKRIREERRRHNLTQEQLAEKTGCTDSYIGQVERGEKCIALDKLCNICNCLGVTFDVLLNEYLDDDDEYLRQLWVQLVRNVVDDDREMIIRVVKAIVNKK